MKVIGLTGGIGAGKSTVSDYLTSKGFYVLDADQIARDMTSVGSPLLEEIAKLFGSDMLLDDGSLDRRALANLVFSDTGKKNILDKLMHGEVIQLMRDKIAEAKSAQRDVIFADVPLLFESGFDQFTDEIWTVSADEKTRIKRVMSRDGVLQEDVLARMRLQMDEDEKKKRADVVLENSGEQELLYEQIDTLLKNI